MINKTRKIYWKTLIWPVTSFSDEESLGSKPFIPHIMSFETRINRTQWALILLYKEGNQRARERRKAFHNVSRF